MSAERHRRAAILRDAAIEAERFATAALSAAEDLEERSMADFHSKLHATAKRRSLDLTNALVRVRRGH